MICQYLTGYRAGEILDPWPGRITQWGVWTEYDCTHEEDCPFLDDLIIECPIKENNLKNLEDWAIRQLAGDRKDMYTRVRELMVEAEA